MRNPERIAESGSRVASVLRKVNRRNLLMGAAGATAIGAAGAVAAGVGVALAARAAWNSMNRMDLRGKVVLVTGASRGLGFALAQEFARHGCKLIINARKQDALDIAAEELRRMGASVLAIAADVGNRDEVERMVQRATAEFDRIDILVNNAGVIQVGPLQTQTVEDFRESMDVMFWGVVYPTLAVMPQMISRREGRIANITSIGGKIAVPHLVPYGCAKFAAVGFSEGITAELAKDGVKVTTVVPGLMRTGSHVNAYFKGDSQSEYTWFSLGATSPVSAIGARRAARSIVNAIRRGQAETILSLPAMIAARVHGLMPATTVNMLGVVNRFMPGTNAQSKERHRGKESETAVSRSPLTMLGRRAGKALNQYPERRDQPA